MTLHPNEIVDEQRFDDTSEVDRRRQLAALVRPDAVHRDVYRRQWIFDREMDRIFRGTWVFVCHESQVVHPGDYVTVRVGSEPVIVVRDDNGQLQVLVNRCRHRGAVVCEWAQGNAKNFRCQYHGWTYGNDGRLLAVPLPERFGDDVRPRLGLTASPRVEAYRGLVFTSFNPEVPSLVEHLGPPARQYVDRFLEQCGGKALVAHHQDHRIDMHGNWKLQVENGLDGYHAGFTHRSFFTVMQQRTGRSVRFASGRKTATAKAFRNGHAAIDPEAMSFEPLLDRVGTLPDAEQLLGDLRAQSPATEYERLVSMLPGTGLNVGIFPNLQLIGIHIRRIEPVAVNRTVVSVRPLLVPDAPVAFNRLRLRYHELFYGPAGFGQPDDFEMFQRVEEGLDDVQDPWLRFERGLGQESEDPEQRTGAVSDETPQRGQYRRWLELMAGPVS
jgi:phenylpropionate dioxygenase-like ring-hydroxylating dioxygenase large terminal subunit